MSDTYILGVKTDNYSISELISSKIYISYREGFQNISGTKYNNDIGWGCTIRSGQMLFANTILIHYLGREFNLIKNEKVNGDYIYIVSLFIDNHMAKFSINNIISGPINTHITVGKWCGPVAMTHALNNTLNYYNTIQKFVSIVCDDRTIYYHEILQKLEEDNCIFIIMPMRLGLKNINNNYKLQLLELVKMCEFTGMIGGKGNSSYYFIGSTNQISSNKSEKTQLLYLDPHKVQKYNLEEPVTKAYSTCTYGKMSIDELNTTLSIGFYIRNLIEFSRFTSNIKSLTTLTDPLIIIDQTEDYEVKKNNEYLPESSSFINNIIDINPTDPVANLNNDWEFL